VDSPAALPVSDALTMAPKTDGVVMVARALWTALKAVKQARQQFSRIGCPVYGCILNGAPHSRSYYPYYYGYYGYYSYQYAYEYEEDRPRGWSLRITGNRIESVVKRWAQAMVTYLPHLTALGLRFAAYCARKPLFWILLALFAGLLLYEAWLRPPQTPPLQEGIQFMSGRQDDSGVKNADEPPITVLEPDVPAADGRAADTAAAGFSGFKDSLASWVAAFNGRDSARLCGFYDAGEFTFPDGGFAQWTANLGQTLLSARRNGGIITLDSARLEQASPPYARTAADIVLTGKSGTIRSRVVMAWRRSEAGWRIVREKKQKLE